MLPLTLVPHAAPGALSAAPWPPLRPAPCLSAAAGSPRPPRRQGVAAHALPALAGVWQADMLHTGVAQAVATGHAALDAELPGGGWPLDGLTELLQPADEAAPLWPLLLPALVAHQQARAAQRRGAAVLLVGAPQPYLPALAAAGLPLGQLFWVPGGAPAAQLWAAEQALRCADVAAVLAWLPRVRQAALRRLHLATAQRGDGLLFVVRPAQAAREASPAPLRLQVDLGLAVARAPGQGADLAAPLAVHILKRRGPPQAAPLWLPSQPPALRALLAASAEQRAQELARAGTGAQVLPFAARPAGPAEEGTRDDLISTLDRLAVAA